MQPFELSRVPAIFFGIPADKQIASGVYAEFKGEPKVSDIDRAAAATRDLGAGLADSRR